MIQGMQEKDENGHPKMLAYLKHFTAYVVVVFISYHSLTHSNVTNTGTRPNRIVVTTRTTSPCTISGIHT